MFLNKKPVPRSETPPQNPNHAGAGTHIPRYSHSLLQQVESQKLQPRSPYYITNQGDHDDFFTKTDPTLPPHTADKLTYEKLPPGKWIRILKLEPGIIPYDIKCSLIPINLDEQHEQYEALSYTWGAYYDNPTAQEQASKDLRRVPNPIVVNGVWKQVTKSLAHALFHFRMDDRPRYLWADALCINQDDKAEKALQLPLMQKIYQQAREVLVWVGWRSDGEVENAMNLLCYLANQECGIEQTYGKKAIWYDEGSSVETPRISGRPSSAESWYEEDHPADTATVPFVPTSLAPLVPLFEACYFKRLWVFQEVALSPLAAMFWGKARITFEWVALVAGLIAERYIAEFAVYDSALEGLHMCARMYDAWRGAYTQTSFFDLLMETRDLKATQAQDKVWGLLGIKTCDSDPEGDLFIQPDLELKPPEVFEMIARKTLLERRDLRCLAAVEHGEYEEEDFKMDGRASWVPNFARKQATFIPASDTRAYGDRWASSPMSGCPNSLCLTFQGLVVDTFTSFIELNVPAKSHWRSFARLEKLQQVTQRLLTSEHETAIALCLTTGFATNMQDKVPDTYAHTLALRMFYQWREPVNTKNGLVMPPSESAAEKVQMAYKFFQTSAKATYKRCLFKTVQGYLGAGPDTACVGDAIVILFGGSVPFILRPDGDHYKLIGQSYVNGMMEGQAIEAWQKSGRPVENIHIV
ncbi:hypothetical protein SLS60_006807 [Paraconiothyrium brasiliense]|uniref:Heterokaryon incompatibility domain-containing protein n=1 Tax=Paraconiothyrium brasiliense TaxID=300254 RepID=A0ABR3R7U1_9PLEO